MPPLVQSPPPKGDAAGDNLFAYLRFVSLQLRAVRATNEKRQTTDMDIARWTLDIGHSSLRHSPFNIRHWPFSIQRPAFEQCLAARPSNIYDIASSFLPTRNPFGSGPHTSITLCTLASGAVRIARSDSHPALHCSSAPLLFVSVAFNWRRVSTVADKLLTALFIFSAFIYSRAN